MSAVCLLVVSGCTHGGIKASDQKGIRASLARWAAARTPAQACAVMSSGFRFFVGKGDYDQCARDFVAMLGTPEPETAFVESMRERDGQVAVRARVAGLPADTAKIKPGERTFWFVWQRGAWRLNSIGDEVGLGPPCHTYPGHPC